MESTVINSRADLDALVGTAAHEQFMLALGGTLWRLEKDDAAKTWAVVEDSRAIERFGFIRADFPQAVPPSMPIEESAEDALVKSRALMVVSRFQARVALLNAGRLEAVNSIMADPATDALTRMAWLEAPTFRRDSPTVAALAVLLDLDAAQLDALFVAAEAVIA